MFLKNLHFYRLEDLPVWSMAELQALMFERKARDCGQMETSCAGWQNPLGEEYGDEMLRSIDGNHSFFCLCRGDKILPASVIREKVQKKVFEIERAELALCRQVSRKERLDIQEQILTELLPHALVKTSRTFAYISLSNKWLVVGASSVNKSEEVIEMLRKTAGSLPVVIPATDFQPEIYMTGWMLDTATLPEGFTITDSCELRSQSESAGVIRCRHIDISQKDILAHVGNGYRVTKLRLHWRERIEFTLHADLSLHSIKFDVVDYEDACDDTISLFDADAAMTAGSINQLLDELIAAMTSSEEPKAENNKPVFESASDDSKYNDAADLVIEKGQCSVSMIQRYLRIGYNRASRLVEQMESKGLVSAPGSGGIRKVLTKGEQ